MKICAKVLPSAEYLNQIFLYNPETGELINRVTRGNGQAKAGDLAGGIGKRGYRTVLINGKRYPAHRLIWAMMTGIAPKVFLDHRNNVRHDNRWVNLREADALENRCNSRTRSDNASGEKGCRFHKGNGKWDARIMVKGKSTYLGYFTTKEAAAVAYAEASRCLHGEFGRAA